MRVSTSDWLEAQNSVIGSALIDDRAAAIVLAETEESDYSGACRTVFNAIKEIYSQGKPLDPVVVASLLGPDYRQFIMQLMEMTPTAANLQYYITLCKEQARVLALREIGKQLAEAENTEKAREYLEAANGCMVSRQRYRSVTMADALMAFMDSYNERPSFLSWPFPGFSDHLRVKPGRFILIGAEPSVGKTAFSLQCAWHWAKTRKVGFFSLETDKETLTERLLANLLQLPLNAIMERKLTELEHNRFCAAVGELAQSKLEFVPASGMTTADIRAKVQECGYEVIVIDYLQLMKARGGSRYEQVTSISLDLHTIAQTLGVTVVALSQLSRSADDHTPRNSDLRESGQLEQDADVIMMMKLEKQTDPAGPRKLFVTKNKEGELFMTQLSFVGKFQTFSKAARTGEVVSKMTADGKRARARNKMAAQGMAQLSMLPPDTKVPFEE